MKNILLFSIAVFAMQAHAEDALQVPWKQVCRATDGKPIHLTTTTGETVDGLCMSVNVDEISVRQGHRQIQIARSALAKIQVHRSRQGKQLPALHREIHRSFRTGLATLFSPMAPAGLIMVPGTLAWGAVAAPFCLLADIGDGIAGMREIKVL